MTPSPATCVNKVNKIILEKRYLVKNEEGSLSETPEEMFWRVALCVAEAERNYGADDKEVLEWANKFYTLMATGIFEPNTPTLINAGRDNGLGFSACYVLPIKDSLVKGEDSIYGTLTSMAKIHQGGGGTGFSFSDLRPEGSMVNSTTGVASGPISFMSLYDTSTDIVKQGGTRRGANMGILHCSHPDILKFVTCKSDTSRITNFNISVAITDEFMRAVKENAQHNLLDPRTGDIVASIPAAELFEAIVKQAHATGEPGLFFIDAANKFNPVPHLGKYEATNPCGEQPLLAYDVCNLGSINVGKFATDPNGHPPEIDWDSLQETISQATRFLDNIIDVNNYALPQIKDLAQNIRRIGLGIMGWADLLIQMELPYNSTRALEFAEYFMFEFKVCAYQASQELAGERGVFPEWKRSIFGPDETCARSPEGTRIAPHRRMRNCNVTTIAPTGSISIIAGCSGGIEPLFAVAFMRNQAGERIPDVNQEFVRRARMEEWYSKELINRIAEEGSIDFPEVPDRWKSLFVTAQDIEPEYHVRMQAAFQKHCDSAISKTINLPREATIQDVRDAYLLAHTTNCKGITVYRDGSRPEQVLSTGKTTRNQVSSNSRKRSEIVRGFTRKIQFAHLGKIYVTVNMDEDNGEPVETFIQWGKAGTDENSIMEALGRLVSLALKEGVAIKEITKQLRGIGGKTFAFHKGETFSSIPDAIAKTIDLAVSEEKRSKETQFTMFHAVCPECNEPINYSEGCNKCLNCGFSTC